MANQSDWILRIICSVDVIGSTAHKSIKPDDYRPLWAQNFRAFYEEFPSILSSSYDDLDDCRFSIPNNRLEVWKFLGDEILFFASLCDYRHSLSHVLALKQAVIKYNEIWKKNNVNLKLKATAWLAGFPVLNTEVSLEVGDENSRKKLIDFIGPAIDSGFRLGKFADEHKFVVSVGLASMLLDAISDANAHVLHACKLFYSGSQELKGVIQGKPYPIIWIRMGENLTLEEKLRGLSDEPMHDVMKKFLHEFIAETPGLYHPFISGDRSGKYDKVPPEFEKARKDLAESEEAAKRSYKPNVPESSESPAKQLDEPKKPPQAKE